MALSAVCLELTSASPPVIVDSKSRITTTRVTAGGVCASLLAVSIVHCTLIVICSDPASQFVTY